MLCGKYIYLVVSGHNSKLYLSLLFSEESQALQPYLQDILCEFSDIHDNSPSQSQTQTLSHTKMLSSTSRMFNSCRFGNVTININVLKLTDTDNTAKIIVIVIIMNFNINKLF